MAKLYFKYATMNAGKSTLLLQNAHNYKTQGFKVLLFKPSFDTRDNHFIKSRLGIKQKVDISLKKEDNIFNIIKNIKGEKPYIIFCDESQFLTKQQVKQLWKIAVLLDVIVICYGLRNSYTGEGFEGSKELLTLAHKIEEIKSIDTDGNKCTMHLRKINNSYVFNGNPTIIGDIDIYEPCSAEKWLFEYNKYKNKVDNIKTKQNLFIDFDSTICDTNKAYCDYYNIYYSKYEVFKKADHKKIKEWNYTDECPIAVQDSEKIFGKKELFNQLEFFPNAYQVLSKLTEKYNLIIVSIGSYNNIHQKSLWIKNNLPFIHESILLCKDKGIKMGKSVVNMKDGIFIDDVKINLDSTNAARKILFGRKFKWNEEWKGEHCLDWLEIANKLL